ncbi:MAG: MnmC family methyltransferase [Thermostichales cyanobacterium DRC_bins_46]
MIPITTGDGSLTFYSQEFGQAFHNRAGAYEEALEKFVLPCQLLQLAAEAGRVQLLDVCFGLGYNSAVAISYIRRHHPQAAIEVIGLERSPEVPAHAWAAGVSQWWDPEVDWQTLLTQGHLQQGPLRAEIRWGDARQTIQGIPDGWADAVFFDPFSPSVCPELWTVEFMAQVARTMGPRARLATYSCSAAARSAMLKAGLHLGSTPPVGRPWPGTLASKDPQGLPPLSPMDQEHLRTRAAVPFRDPDLRGDRASLIRRRQQEQQQSSLEPTAAWKKRWLRRGEQPES